jgi:hypothetical protein
VGIDVAGAIACTAEAVGEGARATGAVACPPQPVLLVIAEVLYYNNGTIIISVLQTGYEHLLGVEKNQHCSLQYIEIAHEMV